MSFMKPLVASFLLGLASLAGCGERDTEQEAELQPTEPRQEEREQVLAELETSDAGTQEHPICRNLQEGDPYYPNWTYCCDNDDGTQSRWTGANGKPSGMWAGSCYSWGIR